MVYVPLLILVTVAFWVAGWRKGLEITILSAFLCLLFGIWFHPTISPAEVRQVPYNLWVGLRGILSLPVYLVLHPGEWLYILVPIAVLVILMFAIAVLRSFWQKPAK